MKPENELPPDALAHSVDPDIELDPEEEDGEDERRAFETRDLLYALAGRTPVPQEDLYIRTQLDGVWDWVGICFPFCLGWFALAAAMAMREWMLAGYIGAAMVMSYGAYDIRQKILLGRRSKVTMVSLSDNIAALDGLRDISLAPNILYTYVYLQERDPLLAAAAVRILHQVKANDKGFFDVEAQAQLRSIVMTSQVPEVRLAGVEALFQVGDGQAYQAVEPILASPACRENPESLRERAREVLPELLNRAKEAKAANKLLRPALTDEDKLLRPAGHAETDETQLLRPNLGDETASSDS